MIIANLYLVGEKRNEYPLTRLAGIEPAKKVL